LDILQDPTRISKSDKLSFHFCPKTGKVLTYKGDKNAYEIDRGLAEASITDMLAFPASGMICSPMLIYPYKRIPSEITKRVPDDWGVGHSPTEWMTIRSLLLHILEIIMSSSLLPRPLMDTAPI
jgi:hypothetical protein